jgi:hypothetical protein
MIVERAEDGLREIMTRSVDDNDGAWVQWMWGNIRGLWNEEIYVARAVAQSISQDIQFC